MVVPFQRIIDNIPMPNPDLPSTGCNGQAIGHFVVFYFCPLLRIDVLKSPKQAHALTVDKFGFTFGMYPHFLSLGSDDF